MPAMKVSDSSKEHFSENLCGPMGPTPLLAFHYSPGVGVKGTGRNEKKCPTSWSGRI